MGRARRPGFVLAIPLALSPGRLALVLPAHGLDGGYKGETVRWVGCLFTLRLPTPPRPYHMLNPPTGWMGDTRVRRRGENAFCSPRVIPRHPTPTAWV